LLWEVPTGVTKSRKVTKFLMVDLDLIKPCWEEFRLDLKKKKKGKYGHV
jgi:hypothetical protein